MRWFLSLALALTCAFTCCAQDVELATAKARAAFALTRLKRDTVTGCDARVKAAASFKKCRDGRDVECLHDLGKAIERADAEKKPLFVLVGMACHDAPEIRKTFVDAVWVHVGDTFNGNPAPRLVVRPVGSLTGIPFLRKDFGPDTPAAIREVLRQTPGRLSAENKMAPTSGIRVVPGGGSSVC